MEIKCRKTNLSRLKGFCWHLKIILCLVILGTFLLLIGYWLLGPLNVDFEKASTWIMNNISVFATVIVTLILAAITLIYTIFTRRSVWQNALLDVQKEYASSEMMSALQFLWNFYKKGCGKDEEILVKRYKLIVDIEKEKISKKKLDIENSFDYHRRLITHFYFHLADIYINKILPAKIIFSHWEAIDLDIIPSIIIPLDIAQEEISGVAEKRRSRGIGKIEREKLKKLYRAAYIWEGFVCPPEVLS